VLLHVTRALAARSKTGRLCFAGGVALNCLANGRIARESGYDEVFVPAAPGDGGTSLGAALHWHHVVQGQPRRVAGVSPYLGCAYDDAAATRALSGLDARRAADVAAEAARLVAEGRVIGWFQGRSEMGPRALGARSVLADPRSPTVARRLNGEIKKREPFRPFAPSVLAGREGAIFDGRSASPYMSFALPVRAGERERVPAVLQVDGTSRIHTVERDGLPVYHRMLERFEELTGLPLVLNTSFNCHAPIVETPEHAVAAYREMGLDALVIGDWVLERSR
jgi:carbamoyltransferase